MKISLSLLLLFASAYCHAQNQFMVVTFADSSARAYELSAVRKITFLGNATTSTERAVMSTVLRSFSLWQNYPNPFNPTTTIQFEIPDRGAVAVNIYDLTGRLVRRLDHSIRSSGRSTLQWDGRNDDRQPVASGVYVLQVRFNNSLLTKKLLLVK